MYVPGKPKASRGVCLLTTSQQITYALHRIIQGAKCRTSATNRVEEEDPNSGLPVHFPNERIKLLEVVLRNGTMGRQGEEMFSKVLGSRPRLRPGHPMGS